MDPDENSPHLGPSDPVRSSRVLTWTPKVVPLDLEDLFQGWVWGLYIVFFLWALWHSKRIKAHKAFKMSSNQPLRWCDDRDPKKEHRNKFGSCWGN